MQQELPANCWLVPMLPAIPVVLQLLSQAPLHSAICFVYLRAPRSRWPDATFLLRYRVNPGAVHSCSIPLYFGLVSHYTELCIQLAVRVRPGFLQLQGRDGSSRNLETRCCNVNPFKAIPMGMPNFWEVVSLLRQNQERVNSL